MGVIGFVDDYIKLYKNDKEGLRGKYKIIGQILLGLYIGASLFFHPDVTVKEPIEFVADPPSGVY